jgi:hypothetical protein
MSAKPDLDIQSMLQQFVGGANAAKARTLPGWWNSFRFQETLTFEHHKLINFAKSAMFAACLAQGGTVLETHVCVDQTEVDTPAGSIEEFAKSAELRNVYMRVCNMKASAFLVSKSAAVQITIDASYPSTKVVADIVTMNPVDLAELREAIEKHYEQVEA